MTGKHHFENVNYLTIDLLLLTRQYIIINTLILARQARSINLYIRTWEQKLMCLWLHIYVVLRRNKTIVDIENTTGCLLFKKKC
jgi:hypothetical protein